MNRQSAQILQKTGFEIITDKNGWNSALKAYFPGFHLHYLYEYNELMSTIGGGEPTMFIYRNDEKVFLHIFLKREIFKIGNVSVGNCYDIKSAFGYVGPISNSNDESFTKVAYDNFSKWCFEQSIIGELIRFNPLLSNQSILKDNDIAIINLKPYTYMDLTMPEEILFNRISSRTKRYIVIAQEEYGDRIKITTETKDLEDFFELYKALMIFKEADSYYAFSDDYFRKLIKFVKEFGFLMYAKLDGKIVAGVIQLYINSNAYPLHGARDSNHPASSLLYRLIFWKSIMMVKNINNKTCLLGGGINNDKNDCLLQFKMFFNPVVTNFYLGKKIHNAKKYGEICKIWETEYPCIVSKYNGFIDKYRFVS